MHRFFVPSSALRGTHVVLPGQVAHQLHTVLCMQAGERIVVLDDSGWEFEVVLTGVGRAQATGQVLERRPAGGEPRARLTLYQSLLKRDHLEWVLQKCTEVGVAEFVPVRSSRTVVSYPQGVGSARMERWRRIVTEAAEQSGRGRLPLLRQVLDFREAIAQAPGYDLALFPWEEERTTGLREALAAGGLAGGAGRAALAEEPRLKPSVRTGEPRLEPGGQAGEPWLKPGVRTGEPRLAAGGLAGGPRLKPGVRTDVSQLEPGVRIGGPGPEEAASVSVALFVGPEGGFSQDEARLAGQYGARSVTLGPRVLRAETAAVVAAALVLYELGELE